MNMKKIFRLMEYPTYESESSTELVVVKGICVNYDNQILNNTSIRRGI